MPLAIRPHLSQATTSVWGQRNLGVGIDRIERLPTPGPQGGKGKPPHLASFFKRYIVPWMCLVFGIARDELLVIGNSFAVQDTGSSQSQSGAH